MRYGLIGLLAIASLALAAPASARSSHHHGSSHRGPSVGFYFGAPAPFYGYTPAPAYGYGRCVRERVVRYRSNGRRVVKWITRCY
jgi:hypothetical protein